MSLVASLPGVKRLIAAVIPILAVTGACSRLDSDVALDEQLDDGGRDDFVSGVVEGAGGVILVGEAQCWSDAVLATGATPADLDRFAADPLSADASQYTGLLIDCIDPAAEVDVAIEGDVRTSFLGGLTRAGLTDEQANCVLDGLIAEGVGGRDMFLAGLLPELSGDLTDTLDAVAPACLAGT